MPKIYTELEKNNINNSLISYAEHALKTRGVKATSIDDIVNEVGIAKGSFYLFYNSKEELFFSAVVNFRKEMDLRLNELLLSLDENHIVRSVTEIFTDLMFELYDRGIYRFYDKAEYSLITRKIDPALVAKEKEEMLNLFKTLLKTFYIEKGVESFYDAFVLLNYALLNSDKIPNIKESLRLIIKGLVFQLIDV